MSDNTMSEFQEFQVEALKLCKGNPGVMTVLADIANQFNNTTDTLKFFKLISSLSFEGVDIWIAYRVWANRDLNKFIQGITEKDKDMIKVVQDERERAFR